MILRRRSRAGFDAPGEHRARGAARRAARAGAASRSRARRPPPRCEAIAACESGGNPARNTGNGFYGKYQFDARARGRASAARATRRRASRGRAEPARGNALRARGRIALARLRALVGSAAAMAFRDEFPVLENIAYLNAGTDGPIPRAAIESARAELDAERAEGRLYAHFARRHELGTSCARATRGCCNCEPEDVAVTSGTSAGLGAVLGRAGPRPGRRDRHLRRRAPGPDRPADRRPPARRDRQARCRSPSSRRPSTAQDDARRRLARELDHGRDRPAGAGRGAVPVILDGAQGAGAVPVDVQGARLRRLRRPPARSGCAGPTAPGCSTWSPEFGERVRTIAPDVLLVRGRLARAWTRALRGERAPLRHPARRARRVALSAGRAGGARGRGPRRDPRPRRRPGRDVRRPRSPRRAARSPRATARRSSPSRTRTRRPRASGCSSAGVARPQPPGPPVPARVGRRLERRVRPRAPARALL